MSCYILMLCAGLTSLLLFGPAFSFDNYTIKINWKPIVFIIIIGIIVGVLRTYVFN